MKGDCSRCCFNICHLLLLILTIFVLEVVENFWSVQNSAHTGQIIYKKQRKPFSPFNLNSGSDMRLRLSPGTTCCKHIAGQFPCQNHIRQTLIVKRNHHNIPWMRQNSTTPLQQQLDNGRIKKCRAVCSGEGEPIQQCDARSHRMKMNANHILVIIQYRGSDFQIS